MHYEELLMDSPTLIKFKLFKKIMFLASPSYPIAQLASEMNLNYQQTVIDLTEIDQELAQLNSHHESILLRAGKINCLNLSCTIDDYRYHLLESSVPFQFVLYFLNEDNPTIDDFCVRYNSSRSTVSRKIENLKTYLKQFNLRFTYTEAGMAGDERLIRLALFNIVWLGVKGVVWPFSAMKEEIADELVERFAPHFPLARTYIGRHELKFLAAIFYLRLKKQNYVRYDKSYNFLMKNNPYYDMSKLDDWHHFDLNPRQRKLEVCFIYFLSHVIPFYTIADDPALLHTLDNFAQRPNPIYLLAKEYLDWAGKHFFQGYAEVLERPTILGNLLNIGFGYYTVKHPFPSVPHILGREQAPIRSLRELQESSQDFLTQISGREEYRSFLTPETIPLIAQSFTEILEPFYDWQKVATKVNVGIALEHNYLLVTNLHRYLTEMKFVNWETFQGAHLKDYDLVITSSLILSREYPEANVFFWDHTGNDVQSISLLQCLTDLMYQKNR